MSHPSDKTPQQEFAAALVEFQKALPSIGKGSHAEVPTKNGGKYSYNYAALPDILEAVLPALTENGLAFTAAPDMTDHGFVLRFSLVHTGGHREEGAYPLPSPAQSTPQQIGSAITYGRRYCFTAVTGIAPDEDDDGQAATDARSDVLHAPKKATRSRPSEPAADEWTTRTDTAWTADFRARLAACPTVAEARGLWAEAAAVQREGRLTADDAELLKGEWQARVEALSEPQAVGA